MLWLAILVPDLPLQVFTRGLTHTDTPFAVVDRMGAARILCANAAALALGVQTGQPLSTAQAVDQSHGLVTRLARSAEQVVGPRRVGQQMIGIDAERADFRG